MEKEQSKKEKKLLKIHRLANNYAKEKIEQVLTDIEDTLYIEDGPKWDKERVRGTVGQIIALSYAIGWGDRDNQMKTLRIIKP